MDAATSTALLYGAVLVPAFLYVAVVRRGRGAGLPPGPRGLPLVGSLLSLDPDLHTYFAGLAARYGPIFSIRLGSKLGIVITSPALAREVLRDQDLVFSNRDIPDAARSVSYGGGQNIVWNPVGPKWRLLRVGKGWDSRAADFGGEATDEGGGCGCGGARTEGGGGGPRMEGGGSEGLASCVRTGWRAAAREVKYFLWQSTLLAD